MNSWARSACYPRSTFYPLSDGASTRYRQITKTYFRTCSACLPRSQATLCLYTCRMIPNHPKVTFARLRYSLGGDRPSQTAHLTRSRLPIQTWRLESQQNKGGIPTSAPQRLTPLLQCLPPILYMPCRNPISGYSKAPRGLSVPPRATGVLTSSTISPGLPSRQRPDRYTIRAGRNLPDKEFRYLRTVIVTAAVYWGLSSLLRLRLQIPVTFQHRAGVSPYTSSFDLAETCVFDKQSLGPILCGPLAGAPLIANLRGQFAEFLNNASPDRLRILSSPTCVGLRYGYLYSR